MKTLPNKRASREAGISLLELLVYMAIFAVVVGFALTTCFDTWANTTALHRDSDDVARALDIGERWRADIRAASGPIQVTRENGVEQCLIPASSGQITYSAADGQLRRQAGAAPATLWLANVKSSQIVADPRGSVPAWRWELELKTVRKESRIHPLFTFQSVAGTAAAQ